MKSKQLKYSAILVIAAIIWGTAFVAQSEGGDAIGPFTFNSVRNFIGTIVLLPLIAVLDKKGLSKGRPKTAAERKILIKGGIFCGTALCLASSCQQLALTLGSPTGKAGFITAVYILIVPIMGIFIKKKCGWNIWIAVAIALAGLYFLCINGEFKVSTPDLLLFACAFLFSIQILGIDHFSPQTDAVRLAVVEFLVCGVLSFIPALFYDIPHLGGVSAWFNCFKSPDVWLPLLYAGVLSSGVAYTIQMVAQPKLNPTLASLIMSLESVFATLSGWLFLKQVLTIRELIGCLLMFVAIILAQLPAVKIRKAKD